MNKAKLDALNAAGFQVGSVQDFLGLSDWENRLVELKYNLTKTVKRLRENLGLTQQAMAKKLESSQSRVAKIEAGSEDVSLDLLVRYLYAVGGSLHEVEAEVHKETNEPTPKRPIRKPTRSGSSAKRTVSPRGEVVTP
jgi:DNA-binding XRE family transcriptional regulator